MCTKSKWMMPATGRPVGRDSAYASRSTFFSTRSANLFRHAERCIPVNFPHGPFRKASLPRATARSTSSLPATGTSSATTESSTGLSKVNLSLGGFMMSTNCRFLIWSAHSDHFVLKAPSPHFLDKIFSEVIQFLMPPLLQPGFQSSSGDCRLWLLFLFLQSI